MNYGYIFVDNLNGHSYEEGFGQLKYSIRDLKKYRTPDEKIYIFNNELEGRNIQFFEQENIDHRYITLSRNYNKSDDINPLNILVEKIISLMNFDEDKDLVLMDIDTSLTQKIPHDFWDENYVVFDALEYPIMQWRNLDKVLPHIPWKQFDINFDSSFMMYNTGVIYLPKKFRKEICEKSLKIVDYLNENFDPDERYGNKLDEQIALSIVTHDLYGRFGNIKFSNEYIHHYWKEKQEGINWWSNIEEKSEVLPLSVGILAWNSGETLRNTLSSYKKNGLFDIVNDVTLFFQETTEEDIKIANEYDLPYIAYNKNIGIGNGFFKLAEFSESENILLLEHDWELIESKKVLFDALKSGISLLESGYNCIRYRHRRNPGFPHYGLVCRGQELEYYSEVIELQGAHLIDCIHWTQYPELQFPVKIQKENDYFLTTSRWSNFSNNPCIYKKDFYLKSIQPFKNKGKYLEDDISYWWARQNFKVAAHVKGLFSHNDLKKHGVTSWEPLVSDDSCEIDSIERSVIQSKIYPAEIDPYPHPGRYTFYSDCMEYIKNKSGLFLEFGVYQGGTINLFSSMLREKVFYGFDSFEGLPEDWKDIVSAGHFRTSVPPVNKNVNLVIGLFDQTLDNFLEENKEPISFLHLDCDIYSSVDYVLRKIENNIEDDCLIIFDDFLNFPNYKDHSLKAFSEFLIRTNYSYEFIGYVPDEEFSRCAVIIKK